ncbi:MAG TPA: hypothetical protein VKU89_04675 [Solirubrobacteraceae bacterium]|nr:hypothetical protein [Solirubrobacteraceae bacterium]
MPAPSDLRGPAALVPYGAPARFTWRTPSSALRFRCRIDGGRPRACRSGVTYRNLAPGTHQFVVFALAADGRRSAPAAGNSTAAPPSWHWRVRPPRGRLDLSGSVAGALFPGDPPIPIDVQLSSSFAQRVRVRDISVTITAVHAPRASASLSCTSADFAVTPYLGPPFTAGSGASDLISDRVAPRYWPTIAMRNTSSNQDGCMGATLTLAYRARLQLGAETPSPGPLARRRPHGSKRPR